MWRAIFDFLFFSLGMILGVVLMCIMQVGKQEDERMKELDLKEEDYSFYLDLGKYGSTRHAGFGLGFERCVMYLTGMSNIRDVIPFPRTVNNCEL